MSEKHFKLTEDTTNYINRLFVDYKGKLDIINSLFDTHKHDADDSVISSPAFKSYEKQFAEAKYAFETAMGELQKEKVPQEYQKMDYKWEVDFDNCELIIEV